MSNHSLPALGTDSPFSHKIVVSIMHEQLFLGSYGELSVIEKEGQNQLIQLPSL